MKIFELHNKVALITGGGGMLGPKHAEAIIECGGKVILCDIDEKSVAEKTNYLNDKYKSKVAEFYVTDVCSKEEVIKLSKLTGKVDILINNAAKDPKIKKDNSLSNETRFENMSFDYWKEGIDAIINGTFICCQVFCNKMLENGGGVVLNIASDLSVIAPDQRIYLKENTLESNQPVKPITYSAAKYAVVGMTKYLAVYFAKNNIRVNCLSPTGVYNDHPEDFVNKLSNIIPMNRMANIDEYKGAIAFLCSDASSYMTGHNLIIDGGKTVW